MTQWKVVIDDGEWLRLFDDADRVVATVLIAGDVKELTDHLGPADIIGVVGEPPPTTHRCEGPELWTGRMQLALLSNDMPAYDVVVREVSDCARCWRAIAHWTNNLVAGDRAARAGSNDAAAGLVLSEIARLTTP
jgi:hypothetical protein